MWQSSIVVVSVVTGLLLEWVASCLLHIFIQVAESLSMPKMRQWFYAIKLIYLATFTNSHCGCVLKDYGHNSYSIGLDAHKFTEFRPSVLGKGGMWKSSTLEDIKCKRVGM